MIAIHTIASSSAGNCHLVSDGQTPLLLDAGVRLSRIKKGLGFGLANVHACLVTHEHQDHARAVHTLMEHGVPCLMSLGTAAAIRATDNPNCIVLNDGQTELGTWTVRAFPVKHDAAAPLGFLMQSRHGGKLLYMTDTAYSPATFQGLSHIMVEANYDPALLGGISKTERDRLLFSHMSIDTCLGFLRACDLGEVEEIHLIHLSDRHSDEEGFRARVEAATGKKVFIAPRGVC